jgi:hypothetical protein
MTLWNVLNAKRAFPYMLVISRHLSENLLQVTVYGKKVVRVSMAASNGQQLSTLASSAPIAEVAFITNKDISVQNTKVLSFED